jgi:hypothetical protein
MVYFATFPAEIVSFDASADEVTVDEIPGAPARMQQVVDVPLVEPGSAFGAILSLASDGTSIFWTQVAGPTTALFRHDFATPADTATVMLWGSAAYDVVAVDDTNVYTTDATTGTLYALPKDAGDGGTPLPIARGALPITPVSHDGQVFFVSANGQAPGPLDRVSVDGGVAQPFTTAAAGPFAIDACWLFYAHGTSVTIAPMEQPSTAYAQEDGDTTPVGGLAAGSGFFAFYTQETVAVFREPSSCPSGSD